MRPSRFQVGESELAHYELDELENARKLFGDLLRPHKQVRISDRERTNARKSSELPRLFVTIHRTEFGKSHGQFTIAARTASVDHTVMRTVHRLQQNLFVILERDRRELAL